MGAVLLGQSSFLVVVASEFLVSTLTNKEVLMAATKKVSYVLVLVKKVLSRALMIFACTTILEAALLPHGLLR